jgi:hypothetical protein
MKLTDRLPACINYCLLILLCIGLCLCSTSCANLTTTAASEAASVDNAGTIAAGAKVVSANAQTGTIVTAIAGTNLTLSLPATVTGTAVATFQNTVAVQFQFDITSYTQTVGNFLQSNGPIILADVGNAAKLTADLATQLQAWGLDPSTSGQRTVLGNAIAIAAKVATGAASLNSTLTGISTTGAVPTL